MRQLRVQQMRLIIGIDPGVTGAVALLRGEDLDILDMPVLARTKRKEVDAVELARLIDAAAFKQQTVAWVEAVNAMPHDGKVGAFGFGRTVGVLHGILAAYFIALHQVRPNAWKRAMRVPAGKDGARARASELLPRYARLWCRAKDHNRAEAALIALYGQRQMALQEGRAAA